MEIFGRHGVGQPLVSFRIYVKLGSERHGVIFFLGPLVNGGAVDPVDGAPVNI
ncbi:hypothetical protein D9M70_603670 [compost metagenome]